MSSYKLAAGIKELRIHFCQKSPQSQPIRDFISRYYKSLKESNPVVPILIRESHGIEPRLWIRYQYGRESNVELSGLDCEQIMTQLQRFNK